MSCFVCKKKPVDLYQCGQCYEAVYCSEECQVKAWKGGHHVVCQKEQRQQTDWNRKLMSYGKEMEVLLAQLQFPSKSKNAQELVELLDKQSAKLDVATEKTKSISYSMMKKHGASQKQMDYIEEQVTAFTEKLVPVIDSTLRGKNDISLESVVKMQGHLDNAQNTIFAVTGAPKKEYDEESAYVDEIVKIVSRSGQILAKSLISKNSRRVIEAYVPMAATPTTTIVSIPKLIGADFGAWIKSIPSYLAGKTFNYLGDMLRDILHCLGSSQDRTYSASARQRSTKSVLAEHKRARDHITQNMFLGSIMLRIADKLDSAHADFEAAALGSANDEKWEEYEAKRQTSSMLFSIAMATGLGVYSTFCYTRMSDYKENRIAELDILEETYEEQKLNKTQLQKVENFWQNRTEEFENLVNGSEEAIRQIEKRQTFFGSIDQKDIAFDKLLKAAIFSTTGCEISTESTALQETKSANLPSMAEVNQDVGILLRKANFVDSTASTTNLDPGPCDPLISGSSGISDPINTKNCDPAQIMPAFKNLFSSMFALAESSLKNSQKLPKAQQSFFDETQTGALAFLESQKAMLMKAVNVVNTAPDWAKDQPEVVSAHFQTLNRANPLLGQSFIGALQQVQQEQIADEQTQQNEWKALATACTLMKNEKVTEKNKMSEILKASENSILEMRKEINEMKIPGDPVNAAMGNISWIINKLFTLGLKSQQQFAGAFIPNISTTYQAMLAMWGKVSTENWSILFSSLVAFLAKMTAFLWWMDVGLVGIAAVGVIGLVIGAPVLTFLRRLGTAFGNIFASSTPPDLKKLRKTKYAQDEGSALNASWLEWIFGGVTFGVGAFFNGLIWGSGMITLTSLMIGLYASSLNAIANVVTAAFTNGWASVSIAFNSMNQLYVGYILLTPIYRFVMRKTDYDKFYCFRLLVLMLSGGVNVASLTEPWDLNWKIGGFNLISTNFVPAWETLVMTLFWTYRLGMRVVNKLTV